jgi:REP element-mobilizing transposase RayT
VQRGHNRGVCFFDEQDDHAYLRWLGEALQRERCSLHAYVLMTNHVHLLMTPERASAIPRFIMAVGRRYVQYINHTYGRTGTLWDSRYKSSLVQAETYLLLCQRYIELNPVRASMVSDPADCLAGRATERMRSVKPMPCFRHIRSTWRWDRATASVKRLTGHCSVRNSMTRRSQSYGWP